MAMKRLVVVAVAAVPILAGCSGNEPSADSLASRAAEAAAPTVMVDACTDVRSAVETNFPDQLQGTYPARVYDAFANDIEAARQQAEAAAEPLLGALVAAARETANRVADNPAADSALQGALGDVAKTCERLGEPLYR
jgi:hypothetical protein